MAWILESTLQAISRCESERSLTFEERLMMLMQYGEPWRPPVDLLQYQDEYRQSEDRNAVHR
jgi:hypothetical protein